MKGGQFERDTCKQLSLWWSDGKDDDLFWRSSQSGGRATVRGRKGKGTRGHCGDITATDSTAEPFIKLITPELKRGYSRATLADLLDPPLRSRPQVYEQWIRQAKKAAKRAGTPFWIIIHKRDKRPPIIVMPSRLAEMLHTVNGVPYGHVQYINVEVLSKSGRPINVVAMQLETFLAFTNKRHIIALRKVVKRGRS